MQFQNMYFNLYIYNLYLYFILFYYYVITKNIENLDNIYIEYTHMIKNKFSFTQVISSFLRAE